MVPPKPSNEDGTYSNEDLAAYMDLRNIKVQGDKVSGRYSLIPVGQYARISGIRHSVVVGLAKKAELNHIVFGKTTFIIVDADWWVF